MQPNDLCVNLINLKHRKDRLESALKQFQEQGITNYRVWEGIVHPQPFTGIAKAYKQIIQYAKDNKLPMVAICEDDIFFSGIGAWNYFINHIPDTDWNIFLSSIYWGNIDENNMVKEFSGFTLAIFNSNFYDTFLSTPEQNHIDRQMKIHGGKYYVCNPFCAKQFDGFSDNAGRMTNYNEIYLKGKKFFTPIVPKTLL